MMIDKPLMSCGHVAQGYRVTGGEKIPVCVICGNANLEPQTPDLTGREAQCVYCKTRKPSSTDLPFFEYKGEGSPDSINRCECGFFEIAHGKAHIKCKTFKPRGAAQYDDFYCGCRGWN